MGLKKIKTYAFSELDDEGKENALNQHREINVHDLWYEYVYDDAKEVGKMLGIYIDNIYFSGFWSQGDGACFEGSYEYSKGSAKKIREHAPLDNELHEIADNLQKLQRKYFYGLYATIKHSGHYNHPGCTQIDVRHEWGYDWEDIEDDLEDALRDFMYWIYSQLEKEYEFLTSDEMVAETLLANLYEFDQEGNQI